MLEAYLVGALFSYLYYVFASIRYEAECPAWVYHKYDLTTYLWPAFLSAVVAVFWPLANFILLTAKIAQYLYVRRDKHANSGY